MKRFTIVLAVALCALPIVAPAAANSSSVVKISLPGDLSYDFKKGPGQEVAQTYCLTCHSSAYVSMQAPMDAAHWAKTVAKMRKAYGMQMSDGDAAKVSEYLGTAYGPPAP